MGIIRYFKFISIIISTSILSSIKAVEEDYIIFFVLRVFTVDSLIKFSIFYLEVINEICKDVIVNSKLILVLNPTEYINSLNICRRINIKFNKVFKSYISFNNNPILALQLYIR